MSDSVDATVTVWQYPFPFLYYLVRVRVCRIRAVQLDNKTVLENMAEIIQVNNHYAKCQPKNSRSHLYRSSPLGNKSIS